MRLRGLAVVAVAAAAAVWVNALPAMGDAWGKVDCTQNPDSRCRLGAGSGGSHTPRSDGEGSSGGGAGGGGREETKNPSPDLHVARCSYQRSDYKPPPDVVRTAYEGWPGGGVAAAVPAVYSQVTPAAIIPAAGPKPGESGAWYVYKCTADGARDAFYRPPIWIPNAPQRGGAARPTPGQLAQVARNQLRLPSPRVAASPASEQLVGLPTWLWMDRGDWGAVSATAQVPGVSVTAVARPTSVTWTMGDGGSETCAGPGTPYRSTQDAKSASPDCGYTYRTSSAGQPNSAFAVSATVHWTVTWAGAGQSGVFPDMTTISRADIRVAESQALNNGG